MLRPIYLLSLILLTQSFTAFADPNCAECNLHLAEPPIGGNTATGFIEEYFGQPGQSSLNGWQPSQPAEAPRPSIFAANYDYAHLPSMIRADYRFSPPFYSPDPRVPATAPLFSPQQGGFNVPLNPFWGPMPYLGTPTLF